MVEEAVECAVEGAVGAEVGRLPTAQAAQKGAAARKGHRRRHAPSGTATTSESKQFSTGAVDHLSSVVRAAAAAAAAAASGR